MADHGRREEGGHAHEGRLLLFRLYDETIVGDVGPQIHDSVPARGEHRADERFPDVVYVTLYRSDDHGALRRPRRSRLREDGAKKFQRGFHGLRAKGKLGKEVLSSLPEPSRLADPDREPLLDDVYGVEPAFDRLPGEPRSRLAVPLDHRIRALDKKIRHSVYLVLPGRTHDYPKTGRLAHRRCGDSKEGTGGLSSRAGVRRLPDRAPGGAGTGLSQTRFWGIRSR
ncbi:MAG: hypothetical protein H6Q78_1328 [Candidatus Krumholzibacteriota bacterium]|nr:hypothetical protein [Candidatus Krumholzibacteriota bacterium]